MANGIFHPPTPMNEPIRGYAPQSWERAALISSLQVQSSQVEEVPVVIGGKRIFTGNTHDVVMPHNHGHILARVHLAGEKEVALAVEAAKAAWHDWSRLPWTERAAVLLRAAELLAGPWRDKINASTMLGQSKTCHQAEIDAACELIDFWRYNVHFAREILEIQPQSAAQVWNRTDVRPLEGFVLAISPFNFSSIGANLASAPALMGNTVLWKPATTAALSNYHLFELMEAAGMPPGVINFLPGHGPDVGNPATVHPDLGGIHFTGSTSTFNWLWKQVGTHVDSYKTYPRIVGETGGKDFIFAHASADPSEIATAILRGAFEYQGQKCSAASRAFIPESLWPEIKRQVQEQLVQFKVGDVEDFKNFMGAVIDAPSFKKITGYLDRAKADTGATIISGGGYDDAVGYFIEPTIVQVDDPNHELMTDELFGPVLGVFVYPDAQFEETLKICDEGAIYALTGAIFATDRQVIVQATDALRHSAGNFYINDKPTGAVVGQQPFGGSRKSGTNDKAGSLLNLLRWTSPRTIKENLLPARNWRYPFLS